MKIGIFDSGIGGINVLNEVIKKYPKAEYIYYGDTLHLPYGEKTKQELIELSSNIIRFFETLKVDKIIIACGTCSGLIEEYKKITNIPIYDVITPTVEYVKKHYRYIGLLATNATILNGFFQKKLELNEIEVERVACPSFVPYIEGLNETLKLKELESLKDKNIESVILGCTHYPLLENEITSYLKVPAIDMGKCLVESLEIEQGEKLNLVIYMSKIIPNLKENVEKILNLEVELIELVLS